MAYELEVSKKVDKIFDKIAKKNKGLLNIIDKKIRQILLNPYQFKPLRGKMKNLRRVHIGKSFVLVYEILETEKVVRLLDYDHHDKVYY